MDMPTEPADRGEPGSMRTGGREASRVKSAAELRALDRSVDAFSAIFANDDRSPDAAGPLSGLAFAVKEVLDQKGRAASWGIDILRDRVATRTAPAVSRIAEVGAVAVGTTRSTVLAIAGDSGTRNPWDTSRSPGGSSAGSAAAVATGAVDFALGTQTVGSIVRPAAYCGVVGFKPGAGIVPTEGGMCLSEELDHVGFLAGTVATVRAAFSVFEPAPATAPVTEARLFLPDLPWARAPETGWPALAACVRTAAARIGWTVEPLALPGDVLAQEEAVLRTLLVVGIDTHHGAFVAQNRDRLPDELVALAREGRGVDPVTYADALAARDRIRDRMAAALPKDGVLLMPSAIDLPPRIGEGTGNRTPQRLATLLGWPCISLPWGSVEVANGPRLPVGIQLVAGPGRDHALLDVTERLEAIAPLPIAR